MNAPDINAIRQHPAFCAISEVAQLLTAIEDARRKLALAELDAITRIPECLNTYFNAAGDAANDRIDLGNGQELIIDEEWWDCSNKLKAVHLTKSPKSLGAITLAALSSAESDLPQA